MANQMLAEVEKALESAPHVDPTSPTTTAEPGVQLPDVIVSTVACLAVAIIAAVPGWMYLGTNFALYLLLIVVLMGAGIYVARRSPVSAGLALGYSALLGLMMGAFTHAADRPGRQHRAHHAGVIGTFAGAVGMLAVYSTPFGKKASQGRQAVRRA